MSRTRFVAFGGFLGAGKTTTMIRAAQELTGRGERVAIVTNDQGNDLVDTATVRAAAPLPVGEVTGGCFCCRFEDLARVVDELVRTSAPTIVLAEAVGSCTDLQSTVIRPLRALLGGQLDVAPLLVVVDPVRYRSLREEFRGEGSEAIDLAYLYHHQIAEGDVIALNKIDRLEPGERDQLVADIGGQFPGRRVLAYSAATGEGVDGLSAVWSGRDARLATTRPFDVDYDRYAAVEAALAWTNAVYEITGPVVPDEWVAKLLQHVNEQVLRAEATVGHVKVRVATARGCAKASLTKAGGPISRDQSDPQPSSSATALVNARVAADPSKLADILGAAVAAADGYCATRTERLRGEIFQPGYPVPQHRM